MSIYVLNIAQVYIGADLFGAFIHSHRRVIKRTNYFLSKYSFVVYQSGLHFGPHILAIMIVFANKTVLFQNNVRLHLLIRSAVIEIGHWYCLECKFTVVNHSKPPVHIIYIIYK